MGIIGQIFVVDWGSSLWCGWTPKLRITKFDLKKPETSLYGGTVWNFFDVLNRLGVRMAHQCDRRTDGGTGDLWK